jgi:mannose-6-phosphate isomerase
VTTSQKTTTAPADEGSVSSSRPGRWPAPMANPVRDYDWGSTTTLARLQGRRPSGRPEAELWMGAHPSSPSRLLPVPEEGRPADGDRPRTADDGAADAGGCDGDRRTAPANDADADENDGDGIRLDELIAAQPLGVLGPDVHRRFGARLPFMLKLLAIAHPLSVQVHPTAGRAREAFEGEADVRGEHVYADPFAKPEMLYALEPVDAMCGFRSADEARHLLGLIGGPRMAKIAEALDGDGSEEERIEAAFERLVTWPADDRADLVTEVAEATRRLLVTAGPQHAGSVAAPAHRRALTWASRLTRQHSRDPLVAAPFLLELVQLEPGETLFVPAGAPHCYLSGLGLEILGNSDNVLRAGLTHKPIAVEELLHIVHGGTRPQRDVPQTWVSPYEVVWDPGVPEFRLSRVWLHDSAPVAVRPHLAGPQIVLCTAGAVRVRCGGREVELSPGRSAFVGAGAGPVTLSGVGEVFRAFTGDGA